VQPDGLSIPNLPAARSISKLESSVSGDSQGDVLSVGLIARAYSRITLGRRTPTRFTGSAVWCTGTRSRCPCWSPGGGRTQVSGRGGSALCSSCSSAGSRCGGGVAATPSSGSRFLVSARSFGGCSSTPVERRSVMRLSEPTKDKRGREYRPKLGRVRAVGWRDVVRVKMVKGQAPEQWEPHASGLAHSFNAEACRVRVRKPGRLELDFIHSNPLAHAIPVSALVEDVAGLDLRRVAVGRTGTGKPLRLQLLGTHVLTVGVSGAGRDRWCGPTRGRSHPPSGPAE
jgi:hypothetical protein